MSILDADPVNLAFAALVLGMLYLMHWELTVGRARRAMIAQNGCEPGNWLPDWDPILGIGGFRQILRWAKDRTVLEGIAKRYEEMGVNTFFLNSAGVTVINTIEPENLKTVQALKFDDWYLTSRRKDGAMPFLGPGIFTIDGKAWQHSRTMLRPNFVRSQIGDLPTFEHHVSHLIDLIPRDGATVDLQELFFRLTIDSATDFLFGTSTDTLAPGASDAAKRFAAAFNGGQESIVRRVRFGKFTMARPDPVFKQQCKEVHDFVDVFVDDALARRDEIKAGVKRDRYVFLDELVTQTSDKDQIRAELMNILLAGRDTTASLLSNLWFTLSRQPEIFDKLRAELAEVGLLGRDAPPPSFTQLKDLKYLKATLNECLRVYPVVPINSREAVRDTVLPRGGGKDGKSPVFVKKGTILAWSLWSMHRRTDIYGPDAAEFKPERWLGRDGLRPGWEYLPFNGGPRICLGQQFALTEASYTTVRLLQHFNAIESRHKEPWREYMTLTCVGHEVCRVALTPEE